MMSENWVQSDNIAMDNPLGGIKRGWTEIKQVYERIFNGPAEVYVEYFDYTIHETAAMFYAAGREQGYFRLSGEEITLAIRTSRIFQKIDDRWNLSPPSWLNRRPAVVGQVSIGCFGQEAVNA